MDLRVGIKKNRVESPRDQIEERNEKRAQNKSMIILTTSKYF